MALGNGSGFNNGPLVFLTPRAKNVDGEKLEKPHFSVGRIGKDGKIIQSPGETPSSVSGDLVSIQIKDKIFKKGTVEEKTREVSLYLRDNSKRSPEEEKLPRETYRLPLTFSHPSRGLFNSLANLTEKGDFNNLVIYYYRNKDGYETFGLKQNENSIRWKYSLDELPEPIRSVHPVTKKELPPVYDEVNDFFEKELLAIAAKVGGGKKEETKMPPDKPGNQVVETKSTETEEDDNSVPF